MKAVEYLKNKLSTLNNINDPNIKIAFKEAQQMENKLLYEILVEFQTHLHERELLKDTTHVFDDEAKIFLYDKFMK